jgi:hypothetical protein
MPFLGICLTDIKNSKARGPVRSLREQMNVKLHYWHKSETLGKPRKEGDTLLPLSWAHCFLCGTLGKQMVGTTLTLTTTK